MAPHDKPPPSFREIAVGFIVAVLMVIVLPYLFMYGPTLISAN